MLDPDKSSHAGQSLYARLGSYDGIVRFVRELMPRLHSDPKLGVYWKGKSLDSRRRGDKLLTDFLCAAFEGPVEYFGPDMKTAHEGLGITTATGTARLLADIIAGEPTAIDAAQFAPDRVLSTAEIA